MLIRCSKCGTKYIDDVPQCSCGVEPVIVKHYKVPLKIVVSGIVVQVDVTEIDKLLKDGTHILVDSELDTPNILVNGELNNVAIGKKIKEKNEQLKKKHAGYEHEQKNLKKHIEKQIEQKHRKEGII